MLWLDQLLEREKAARRQAFWLGFACGVGAFTVIMFLTDLIVTK